MLCTRNSDHQLVPGHTDFAGHLSRRTDGCSRQISAPQRTGATRSSWVDYGSLLWRDRAWNYNVICYCFTAPPLQLALLPQAVNCICFIRLLLLHTLFCTHEICMHITTIYVLRVHSSVECSRACGMRWLVTIFITFREGRFLIVSLPFKRFLWFL